MHDRYQRPFELDPQLNFTSPLLVDLHRYWRDRCGDRAMPGRADIDPLDPALRPHLGFLVLTDVLADGAGGPERFRFRLIGSTMTRIVGRNSTGKFLDELYSPADYAAMIVAYRSVVASRAPLRIIGTLRHANRSWIEMESLDLPLSRDGASVDMILTRSVLANL